MDLSISSNPFAIGGIHIRRSAIEMHSRLHGLFGFEYQLNLRVSFEVEYPFIE